MRLQFRLGTILWLILAVGLALGWWVDRLRFGKIARDEAQKRETAERERDRAVQQSRFNLKELRGDISYWQFEAETLRLRAEQAGVNLPPRRPKPNY